MNYSQFEIEITDILSEKLKDDCEVIPTNVTKNNNTTMRGLRFVKSDRVIQPTIYLEGYFRMYEEGESVDVIADLIYDSYNEAVLEGAPDMSFFFDYKNMKDRIVCKLINASKNKQLLKEVPHVLFLDLAAVFYCKVDLPGAGEGSVLIYNHSFNNWGVSVEDMYIDALKNNERLLGAKATPIAEVLKEIWNRLKNGDEEFPYFDPAEELSIPMYVLTNRIGLNGAACMLNKTFMEEFSDGHGGDFYIIPSSVHELILLPIKGSDSAEELRKIVKTINRTELPAADILSDEVYLYNREMKAVVMA